MQLTVMILTINEADNLVLLLPAVRNVLRSILASMAYEILVIDGGSQDGTAQVAKDLGARVIQQKQRGYGNALREGILEAQGEYILAIDADLSHEPDYARRMWDEREQAEITVASRYVVGGSADMPGDRLLLSKILNTVFRTVLATPIQDMSSGFRLYKTSAVKGLKLDGEFFDILEEILVRAQAEGWKLHEIPFHYKPRHSGNTKARLMKFGMAYLRTLGRLWRLRNSIEAADYDLRAFGSRIVFQRYWQQRRHKLVTNWVPKGARTLDIGCGSSRILIDLQNTVGLDIRMNKLRFMRRFDKELLNGSLFQLPFSDQSFDCVICSQVIEHVAFDENIFSEFQRVLRSGGTLILGTPDYASWQWVTIETIYKHVIPGGYADEHITHYTHQMLKDLVDRHGFDYQETASILKGEIILRCLKR